MKFILLDWLVGDRVMQSVCWTLLHSLWPGLLVAIIGAIIIMSTRKSEPKVRYYLLAVLFLLFIVNTGITLMRQLLLVNKNPVDRIEMPLSNIPGNNTNYTAGDDIIS